MTSLFGRSSLERKGLLVSGGLLALTASLLVVLPSCAKLQGLVDSKSTPNVGVSGPYVPGLNIASQDAGDGASTPLASAHFKVSRVKVGGGVSSGTLTSGSFRVRGGHFGGL